MLYGKSRLCLRLRTLSGGRHIFYNGAPQLPVQMGFRIFEKDIETRHIQMKTVGIKQLGPTVSVGGILENLRSVYKFKAVFSA